MDIFCQFKEKSSKQIIHETNNFLLVHDAFPLVEGHLLIIPKKHFRCFLEIDDNLREEFFQLKKKTIDFLTRNYQKPVIFEHGVAGQTVLHAHLHLLPTGESILEEIKAEGKILNTPKIPYLFYEYEKEYYFAPDSIKPGFLHIAFAKKLNRPLNGLERAKDLDAWLLRVKTNWSNG